VHIRLTSISSQRVNISILLFKQEYWHVAHFWGNVSSLKVVLTGPLSMSTVCLQRIAVLQYFSWSVRMILYHKHGSVLPTHQHVVTLWQCWACCSEAELINSFSCTSRISTPDTRSVIVWSLNWDTINPCGFKKVFCAQDTYGYQIPFWPKYWVILENRAKWIFDLKANFNWNQVWQLGQNTLIKLPPQIPSEKEISHLRSCST